MKIQLKRSNQLEGGEAKKPSVSQMEYGELAVNYNTEDPALFIKDSADQIVKLKIAPAATVLIADTAPDISDSEIGTLWWNSSEDSGQLFILYDDPSGGGGGDVGGPKWIEASPTTGGSGSGGAEVLVSETAPVVDDLEEGSLWWNSSSTDLQLYVLYNDNGTKKWVEASPTVGDAGSEDDFVNVDGDNMTGNLTLGTDKITLDASDGSATFAGNTVIGSWDAYNPVDSNQGLTLDKNGVVYANRTASGGAIWAGYLSGVETSSITADGSATFAGDIDANNVTFKLDPDNPANYTTTTDSEGNETSVYNGPTLDVKERLQNLISRLDSLESDEIADDATSTLLLTTVNNINAQMTKVNDALTAIRAAANAAGTLDQLKTDIAAATADI